MGYYLYQIMFPSLDFFNKRTLFESNNVSFISFLKIRVDFHVLIVTSKSILNFVSLYIF